MAEPITDLNTFREYLSGIIDRAGHHAPNVQEVLLQLAGAVVLFKDPDEDLMVRTQEGELKNVLWVHIHGTRYCFSYHHESESVQIRRESHSGEVVAEIDNATPPGQVLEIFTGL